MSSKHPHLAPHSLHQFQRPIRQPQLGPRSWRGSWRGSARPGAPNGPAGQSQRRVALGRANGNLPASAISRLARRWSCGSRRVLAAAPREMVGRAAAILTPATSLAATVSAALVGSRSPAIAPARLSSDARGHDVRSRRHDLPAQWLADRRQWHLRPDQAVWNREGSVTARPRATDGRFEQMMSENPTDTGFHRSLIASGVHAAVLCPGHRWPGSEKR